MNSMALGAPPSARPARPFWLVDDGRQPRWAVLGVVASVVVHLGAFATLGSIGHRPAAAPIAQRRIIEIETLPPKPAPPAPPEPAEAPTSEPASRPAKAARRAPASPPPSPARAGRTISAPADANAVADFTMVQGAGDAYAGGVTSAAGTSRSPVQGAAADAGSAASTPARAAVGGPGDRSQPPKPEGSDWDCSSLFPADATANAAHVLLAVRVGPDGRARSVSVLADPGQGFGAAARACAMRQRYRPALDRVGGPVAAQTAPFRVRFTR